MSCGDALRSMWRRIKEPVLAGRGSAFERAVYHIMAGFVTRHKRAFAASDLESLALWLMYHPEAGVLPCDGWRLNPPPAISPGEAAALRRRFAGDSMSVARRLGVEAVALPDSPPLTPAPSVAVHVHVFYPELLPRILEALKNIPYPYDLFVSVPEGVKLEAAISCPGKCCVESCPNRGRDIAPLVCQFGRRLARYDCIAHLHTKKSRHVIDRRDWLGHELGWLLGGEGRTGAIFSLLSSGYGMVAAPDYLPMPEDPAGWMHNLRTAESLAKLGGLDVDLARDFTPVTFPQGSMFWARSEFISRFLSLPLGFEDFPAEPTGLDGTPAHALERLFFMWGLGGGLKVARLEEALK